MNFPGRGSQGGVFDKEFKSDMSCPLYFAENFVQPLSAHRRKRDFFLRLLLNCVLLLSK